MGITVEFIAGCIGVLTAVATMLLLTTKVLHSGWTSALYVPNATASDAEARSLGRDTAIVRQSLAAANDGSPHSGCSQHWVKQEPKAPGGEARGRGGMGNGTLAISVQLGRFTAPRVFALMEVLPSALVRVLPRPRPRNPPFGLPHTRAGFRPRDETSRKAQWRRLDRRAYP
jgi:hypothetical protein